MSSNTPQSSTPVRSRNASSSNKMVICKTKFETLKQQISYSRSTGRDTQTVYQMVYESHKQAGLTRPAFFSFSRVLEYREVRLLILLAALI